MKNLVFVIESLHLGGAEKSLVTLLQNIDYDKYAVDLILFHKEGVFEKFVPEEVTIIYNNIPKLNIAERIFYKFKRKFYSNNSHHAQLFWSIIHSKFTGITKKYDVAIAYNQGFATYFVNQYIVACKKVAWLNIDYQKAGYNIEFDYPIYKNFDFVVAVSPEAKKGLNDELKKINENLNIEIIKDISDKTIIRQQSKNSAKLVFKEDEINIVTVCRLAKQKGLHLAIESCQKLVSKGYSIHWYIVGEGSERNSLEKIIRQKELTNHITLIGMTDNPYPYMLNCDIYVQTSLFEGLGLTVIEASYLNKPIVCTNFPTVYGILKDNETGLIAEMNANSITDKIELLMNDSDLKSKLVYNLSQLDNSDKEQTVLQFENLMN
ncbi:glycosyltransferase [Flavobacterium sp. CAN_S2]|uniref:glycosyltransferase n=1 Tax=Flavobacterium sp. CAN_S2 TaxID=2787726 RepID=UPI0018C973F7